MEDHSLLYQAFVYLSAAVLAVPVAKRLGLGSVLGYLIAGMLIGPFALKLVGKDGEDALHFGEFGVVMMLFLIGLELNPARLWKMRRPILGLGGAQVFATTAIITAGLIQFAELDWRQSLAIGMTFALSSTAIVLQNLSERQLLKSKPGESAFSVLLFQDIAVIPMLAIMPLLSLATDTREATGAGEAWLSAAMVLGVVVGIILAGRFLVRPLLRFIADTGLREVFTAAALALVVGIALAMDYVGLSAALGTFLAGVVLAESEYRHELESNIEPFKGLLLGVFFIAVGASIDFKLLANELTLILLLVVAVMLIKWLVLMILARIYGLDKPATWLFSLALAQGGEFGFVLFNYATENRVLGPDIAALAILVVALSMLFSPLLLILWEKLIEPRYREPGEQREADVIDETENPIIVAGFGRFGQIVARLLQVNGFRTTLLDHDAGQIELTRRFGNKVFYGDASRIDLLTAAGAEDARLLIIALDDPDTTLRMVEEARKHFPNLTLLARAFDRRHAYELMRKGADIIRRETFGSALELGEEALKKLGFRANRAFRAARHFRRYDEESLAELYEFWGDEAVYGLKVRQRNEDLIRLLNADETHPEDDHAWER